MINNLLSIYRIGTYSENSIRPLRVKTKYAEDVVWVIFNNSNIRQKSEQTINNLVVDSATNKKNLVYTTHDRTKLESVLYNKQKKKNLKK